MGFYTYATDVIGTFVEKDFGEYFEYSLNPDHGGFVDHEQFPHIIWLGCKGICGDQGYRYARVLKTVAYVVTDEDDYGKPVVEKWYLKKNFRPS